MKVELRVGRIVQADEFPQARKSYVLHVDFGPELGVKKSSAQITDLYQPQDLMGKLMVAVANFPKNRLARSCRNAWLPAFTMPKATWPCACRIRKCRWARGCCEGRRPRLRLRAV